MVEDVDTEAKRATIALELLRDAGKIDIEELLRELEKGVPLGVDEEELERVKIYEDRVGH